MKKIITAILFIGLFANINANAQSYAERQDIASLIKELDYLIDVTQNMKNKYRGNKERITFNYDALLHQLKTTKARTAEYLNTQGQQIYVNPPMSVDSELMRLK